MDNIWIVLFLALRFGNHCYSYKSKMSNTITAKEYKESKAFYMEKKPRKKPKHHESELQIACVRWFNVQYPNYKGLLFSVPNAAKRGKAIAGIMKAEGLVHGVSDLILLVPNKNYLALCLETKYGKGMQSQYQKDFEVRVLNQGYNYRVYWTIEQFISIINNHLIEK